MVTPASLAIFNASKPVCMTSTDLSRQSADRNVSKGLRSMMP